MDVFLLVMVLVMSVVLFDLAAMAHGTDSREPMPDDHHR